MSNVTELANLIWSVADLLRGDYKQSEYGKVILPFTILKRMDCVLEPTHDKVLQLLRQGNIPEAARDTVISSQTGLTFYNSSEFTFKKLISDSTNLADNLKHYFGAFSQNAREIMERFDIYAQIDRLDTANLLFMVTKRFNDLSSMLHPDSVSNHEMGTMFEELIRKFSEISNETAGEHFTPREVIRLMVNLLFMEDNDILTREGIVKTLYDPACGTGGMLSVAQEYLYQMNTGARLEVFGQELNGETYAVCKSDMLIKGSNPQNIHFGNSFDNDQEKGNRFDYMLCNPPFGVEWKKVEAFIKNEYEKQGYAGRFGAGLPPVSDGSFLFLQHMIAKMKDSRQGGSRIAIVFNGSPLFTGDAGSGSSNIRRWIIENDWLEAIVALPTQLFYNTGIATFVWVVTNRKAPVRSGKVQLINAVDFFVKMRKSLGDKRNMLSEEQISEISRIYGEFQEGEYCKIFSNDDFGYTKVIIDRPLIDEKGKKVIKKGAWVEDKALRDTENIPLTERIEDYLDREVKPHVGEFRWSVKDIGYEIPFTRHFYKYTPLRSSQEILKDIMALEASISEKLKGVFA